MKHVSEPSTNRTATKCLSTHENISFNSVLMTLFKQLLYSKLCDLKVSFKCKRYVISLTQIKAVGTLRCRCLYKLNNRNLRDMSHRKEFIKSLYQLQ
jgi:hypothetical protein